MPYIEERVADLEAAVQQLKQNRQPGNGPQPTKAWRSHATTLIGDMLGCHRKYVENKESTAHSVLSTESAYNVYIDAYKRLSKHLDEVVQS